jgi:hypothetical protein
MAASACHASTSTSSQCAIVGVLAADFEKPFDSPAILVVGHQTDGKSALVEALMGKHH